MPESLVFVGLLLAGVGAGFINVLAGGGSVFVFAGLIFVGLSPAVANATVRMGLLGQSLIATNAFRKHNLFYGREGFLLGLASLPGAILGSFLASNIDESLIKTILIFVMCFVVVSILLPNKFNLNQLADKEVAPEISPWAYPLMFLVGCYGGFIQAGVGFLIMAVLGSMSGASLLQVNSLKVFIVLCYTIPTLVVFYYNGLIAFAYGIPLMIGYATGGWFGVRWSVEKGDKAIRWVVAIMITLMAIKLIST